MNGEQRTMITKKSGIFLYILIVFCFLLVACRRTPAGNELSVIPDTVFVTHIGARPLAVLRTGEQPLWFVFTDEGPLLLETIKDAVYNAPFVPWPLALHAANLIERENEVVMAVNRDGFIKLSAYSGEIEGLRLYHFSGGAYWRLYTIGGFVYYAGQPFVLLYLDERFLDTDAPLPLFRTWTFNMRNETPAPVGIPALDIFPVEEGWSADVLRQCLEGNWYFRVRKIDASPQIYTLRTQSLSRAGINISVDDFFASVPQRREIKHPSLPVLPENFVYTGIGFIGQTLIASWEEQSDFNIGAAGFVVVGLTKNTIYDKKDYK